MVSLKEISERPLAGPETRQKYEVALGKFLVAFNAVEEYLRYSVRLMCEHLDRDELWRELADDDFSRQLKNFKLLALAQPFFSTIEFDRLAKLNATRNKLAHGHFDQNLFTDEFEIVGKQKRFKMTVKQVVEATEEAEELWSEFGVALSDYWASSTSDA